MADAGEHVVRLCQDVAIVDFVDDIRLVKLLGKGFYSLLLGLVLAALARNSKVWDWVQMVRFRSGKSSVCRRTKTLLVSLTTLYIFSLFIHYWLE